MPSKGTAQAQKRGSSIQVNFSEFWEAGTSRNIEHDGLGLYSYSGKGGESEEDIGTVRTCKPLDPECGISAFEVKIVDTGEKNYIAVGVCDSDYPNDLLPGWKDVSVAFHADEGNLFDGSDDPESVAEPCQRGNVIQCLLVPSLLDPHKVSIEFYHNGNRVTAVEKEVPSGGFYGIVGMMSKGEKIQMFPPMMTKKTDFDQLWEIATPSNVTHEGNGICLYSGVGDLEDENIGSVRGKQVIDPMSASHSFEVVILDTGEKGFIAIGLCSPHYPPTLLPGWEETSLGFHADEGSVFNNSGDSEKRTEFPCKKGDAMKCSVKPVDKSPKQVEVSFWRNGELVEKIIVWAPERGFHPCFGMMSTGEKVKVILPDVLVPYAPPKLQFSHVWELSENVQYFGTGICAYKGLGGDENVGMLRSQMPFDPLTPLYNSFEVKIISSGESCFIAIGVCSKTYPFNLLPGWKDVSIGFHADDGAIHHSSQSNRQTSNPCRNGDVMRCTLQPIDGNSKEVSVVFSQNDVVVGRSIMWTPEDKLYACIGMMSRGEVIQVACPVLEPSSLSPGIGSVEKDFLARNPLLPPKLPPSPEPLLCDQPEKTPERLPNPYLQVEVPQGAAAHPFYLFHSPHSTPSVRHGAWHSPIPGYRHSSPHFHPYWRQQSSPLSPYFTPDSSRSISSSFSSQFSAASNSPHDLPNPFIKSWTRGMESVSVNENNPKTPDTTTIPESKASSLKPSEPLVQKSASDTCLTTAVSPVVERAVKKLVCEDEPDSPRPLVPTKEPVRVAPPEPEVLPIPKEVNRMFKYLCNVDQNEDGSLECTVDGSDIGFVMCRHALSEKMSYFEVTIENVSESSLSASAVVGVVWDRFPVNKLPGRLGGSLAFDSSNGFVYTGAFDCTEVSSKCANSDVIGCKVHLHYKSEAPPPGKDGVVTVEFFKNGLSIRTESLVLPPTGLFPAVALTGRGTRVRVCYNIMLNPEAYFSSHPIPEGYVNFEMPSDPDLSKWECLQNAQILEGEVVTQCKPQCGIPAIVQNKVMYSTTNQFFEVTLCKPVKKFSVLSVGAIPKLSESLKQAIPGEVDNSVSYLPLLGILMRNGNISSTVPETITATLKELMTDKVCIGVGVEFEISGQAKFLFTVNKQLVGSVTCPLLEEGFYPTVAFDLSEDTSDEQSLSVCFPQLWPPTSPNLPHGFSKASEGFFCAGSDLLMDSKGLDPSLDDSTVVRVAQASLPLSRNHSYFAVKITSGGENYKVSVGLASYNHPTYIHPGWGKESIAFHADDGCIFTNSSKVSVSPPCCFSGAVLGCGARFPDDGSMKYAEVFFTVNDKVVSKHFVDVPEQGFFPTIGMHTCGGIAFINLNPPDPYTNITFATTWGVLENMHVLNGRTLKSTVASQYALAQLSNPASSSEVTYFKLFFEPEKNRKMFVGFCNTKETPFSSTTSLQTKAYFLDVSSEMVVICEKQVQVGEACSFGGGCHTIGCGICPVDGIALLFFTVNNQLIYCREIVDLSNTNMFPSICLVNSFTSITVDACALWPSMTSVGRGWARYANLQLRNMKFVHSASNQQKLKIPLGFAQAALPLTPTNSYFELEVCSRAANKAIAIGLASRDYRSDTWVGVRNNSIAYHLDDGKLFRNSDLGHNFGPKVFNGHRVGCGVRFDQIDHVNAVRGGPKPEVFFTIDGAILGTQRATIPPGGLFPTVCLESPSESAIVTFYSKYPPISSYVGKEWGSAYNIQQVGRMLQSNFNHKELHGGLPKSYCQANHPLVPEKPFFEVEVIGITDHSVISIGIATRIPPSMDSLLYSSSGQIVVKKSSRKNTHAVQKFGLGDRVGCALVFSESQQASMVNFFLNSSKVLSIAISDGPLKTELIYPTIVLSYHGDAVVPMLQVPVPKWDVSFLIGWLRSERVKLKNNVVEYASSGTSRHDVGVAQISQPFSFDTNPYFEVEVLDPGMKCTIAIGAASSDYPLNLQPGWRLNSIAYHGDDGKLYQSSGRGESFGSPWMPHDVVGVGVRLSVSSVRSSVRNHCKPGSEVQVYFTKNGEEIGHTTVVVPPTGLFPTVGMHSVREKVKVSLGSRNPCNQDPFALSWRALCGIKLSRSLNGEPTVEYSTRKRTFRSDLRLAVAIAHLPFSETLQYFEITLLSLGQMNAIAIGAVPKNYSLEQAPGWCAGSVSYHTDNGELYNSSGTGRTFGPVPRKGDVIGCGVMLPTNNSKHCSVFFTYNGADIGRVKAALPPDGSFYPALGLTCRRDKVSVRFLETFKPRRSPTEYHFVGLMRILNCSYTDQVVHFTGSPGMNPGTAQFALPLRRGHNYYAVNAIKLYDNVVIGVATRDYPMKYIPGYTSVSAAYDITKGTVRAVYNQDTFCSFDAPVCTVGDTIGCGIEVSNSKDSKSQGYVFFTKNGTVIQKIEMDTVCEDLFPIVGIVPMKQDSALFMDWNNPVFEPWNDL